MARKGASNPLFQKLSPTELVGLGLSKKSERYRDIASGQIISKRQYQKTIEARKDLGGLSNEKIAQLYARGKRQYKNPTQTKAAEGRKRTNRAQQNFNHYIDALNANGARYNADNLSDLFRDYKNAYKNVSPRDLEKLASRKWGPRIDKKTGAEIPFEIQRELESIEDDDDNGLLPFFYH